MTSGESQSAWELPDMFIISEENQLPHIYPDAKKAKIGVYSSVVLPPLSFDEVNQIILEEKLL